MKLAIVAAFKAFVAQVKSNHLDYCKKVVAKSELQQNKKESK